MVDIIVLSSEQSMQQCVNITIVRDMLVEQTTEQFFFVISPIQTDPAVEVSPSDDNATIIITDQPDGRTIHPESVSCVSVCSLSVQF